MDSALGAAYDGSASEGRERNPPEMAPTPQKERYVRNESLFREVNERIAEVNEDFEVGGHIEFLCECGRQECLEALAMSRDDYERVRAVPERFFVKPGHEEPSLEIIVERHDDFVVVVKVAAAGEDAAELDPRS
ncbi:MAG TPA: hypothetical protein VE753_05660 [Gaiellaceae bacterium]|nr:hypothetical protein [Gaiellaceae bacterium]